MRRRTGWLAGILALGLVLALVVVVRLAMNPGTSESSPADATVETSAPSSTSASRTPSAEDAPSEGASPGSEGESAPGPRYTIVEQDTVVPCGADPTAIQIGDRIRVYNAPGGPLCPDFPNEPDSVVVPLAGGKPVVDPGIRFAPSSSAGPHKRILRLNDGRYRMYFQTRFGADKPGIGSAISSDGLTFVEEPGLRITAKEAGFGPGYELSPGDVVPTSDGRYRMYFSSLLPEQGDVYFATIKSAISSDLLTWEVEPGDRIGGSSTISGGEHPSTVLNPDGSVTLFYGRNINYALFYSTSQDGLTFETEDRLVHSVLDSAFIPQPDGTLIGFIGRRDNYGTQISSIVRVLLTPVDPSAPDASPSPSADTNSPLTAAQACKAVQQALDSTLGTTDNPREPGQYRTFAAAMAGIAARVEESQLTASLESLVSTSRGTSTAVAQGDGRQALQARTEWAAEVKRATATCGPAVVVP